VKSFIVAAAMSALSLPAAALSGNEALDWHRSAGGKVSVPLMAYLRGALDSERGTEEVLRNRARESAAYLVVWQEMAPKMFCPPSGADVQQAYEIVVAWLQGNPEQRQLDLAVHARVALRMAWRCNP
jgi:hypothetical protein